LKIVVQNIENFAQNIDNCYSKYEIVAQNIENFARNFEIFARNVKVIFRISSDAGSGCSSGHLPGGAPRVPAAGCQVSHPKLERE
jgi:hypothetical protein